MVGVPKSMGCSTCITRKIKCGMERPSCSKCMHARFSCPGYLKLHKFQDEGVKLRRNQLPTAKSLNGTQAAAWSAEIVSTRHANRRTYFRPIVKAQIQSMSMSHTEGLAGQLCETFGPNLPQGKSLSIFGFITEVPGRLGIDQALDLSVEAICIAHQALLKDDNQWLERSRASYGRALVKLRQNLGNSPSSSETLCAAVLLGVYELLGSTNSANMQHIAGTSAILKANGPGYLDDALTCKMLKSLRGMIVIEAITLQKPCFLDSPEWKDIAEKPSERPFDSLFSILFKLPNILYSAREDTAEFGTTQSEILSTLERAIKLRSEMQAWRETPEYQDMFQSITIPATAQSPFVTISYTSNRAAGLLCTYAAMMILLNGVLSDLCNLTRSKVMAESRVLAEQICQSRLYSLGYAPLGNCYMDFALRVALGFLGPGPQT